MIKIEDKILFDLNWLEEGKAFPPISQKERIERYFLNKKLFESEHSEVFIHQIRRIGRYLEENGIVSYPIILNYNRLISLKTADLVCGESPLISLKEKGEKGASLQRIIDEERINALIYESVLDLSRYGDSIWHVYKGEDGLGKVSIYSPNEWFPIVDAKDKRRVLCHVITWEEKIKTKKTLCAQIHYKGFYIFKRFYLNNGKIGQLIEEEKVNTGLKEFSIIHFSNIVTSDSPYGKDDYIPLDSILCELMIRLSQISNVLDKHAKPSMYGSKDNLDYDDNSGIYSLKVGNYFTIEQGEAPPGYLTWDGNLDSAFRQVEFLVEQLYILSEMGNALPGTKDKQAIPQSGTALRLKMLNPLIKARRISLLMNEPLKEALSLISGFGYKKVEKNEINVIWNDGLPNDDLLYAQVASERLNNKTFSLSDAISYLDGLNKEDSLKKAEEIKSNNKSLSKE